MYYVLTAVVAVGLCLAEFATAADDVLATIERSLAEQYSSIRSIEVKFRVLHNVPSDGSMPQTSIDNAVSREWLLSGNKKLVSEQAYRISNGQMSSNWYSFDGQKAYFMLCWQTDGTRPETIRITDSIDRLYYVSAAPNWMLGLDCLNCDTNVVDWLKRRTPATVRDVGVERIADRDCRKVEFDNVPVSGKFATRAIVWFDPEADWLPRRVNLCPQRYFELARRQMEAKAGDMTPITMVIEPGETMGYHEVTNYVKADDPLLGRPRWFPQKSQTGPIRRANESGMAVTVYEVDSIIINQPISDSRFIPTPAPGTQTEDFTAKGGLSLSVFGGDEGLVIRRAMLKAASPDSLSESLIANTTPLQANSGVKRIAGSAPDARPTANAWWLFSVAAAGVLVATVCVRKWMASRS